MYQGNLESLQGEMSNLYKRTEIQLFKLYASYADEVDVKNLTSHAERKQNSLGWVNLG